MLRLEASIEGSAFYLHGRILTLFPSCPFRAPYYQPFSQSLPSECCAVSPEVSVITPTHPHFLEGEGTYQGPQVIRPKPVLGIQLCNTLLHSQSDAVIYGLEGSERNNEVSLQSLENG